MVMENVLTVDLAFQLIRKHVLTVVKNSNKKIS